MDETNVAYDDQSLSHGEDTLKDMYLTFVIEDEEYGIEIKYVTEIIGIQKITAVPQVENYIKGIINLRGSIIPTIDMRLKFRKPEIEYGILTCIVVLEYNELSIGLIVDSVSEVLLINEEDILPPPNARHGYRNQYIRNIGKVGEDVKLLLDIDRLLFGME